MKLISLNIELKNHYETIFPFLEKNKPDVICLQEVPEDDFNFFKKKLNMHGVFEAHGYVNSKSARHINMHGKRYGVAIFSKKIINTGCFFYWGNEENLQIPFETYKEDVELTKNYVCVWVEVKDVSGKIFRFAVTHFPVTLNGGEPTPHQLEILEPFFKELEHLKEFVLCGDFNAPRGKETFTRIAKRYTDRIPEHYKTSIDQNLHRDKDQKITLMVDGLFTTNSYTARDVELVDGVSDHMAIVATIDLM